MSSWRVGLSHGASRTEVDLIDDFGPLNSFTFLDPDAFIPNSGDFTNQLQVVSPTVPNSWELRGFDIDVIAVGQSGDGESFDSAGTFPNGPLTWKVLKRL